MSIRERLEALRRELPAGVELVAVSKTHPVEAIREAYNAGQRVFGENRAQELRDKHDALPTDIAWHFIGSIQRKNVKYIAPYVAMIHSVDSAALLEQIDREAEKCGRRIDVLMEVFIARELSKHGWGEAELNAYFASGAFQALTHVRIRGLMGMATYTNDEVQIKQEFCSLRERFDRYRNTVFATDEAFDTLSMGMTDDWPLAVTCGSTMVRVGSYIFGG
jgi:pyridoxal phosphate enzyme (YggS family)